MLTAEIDLGVRCDSHVGEAFPPRCAACTAAAGADGVLTERVPPSTSPRLLSPCPLHDGYFVYGSLPCDRCDRDSLLETGDPQ